MYVKTYGKPNEDSTRLVMYLASNGNFKVERHREQHVQAVLWSTSEKQAAEAKAEKRRWQRDTFWALWTVSSVRALGFVLRESCSRV